MKSRVKNSPTPPELKTMIYEQTGKVGEITAKKLSDLIQAYALAHPEACDESKENVPEGLENSSYYSNEQVKIHSLKPENIVFYSERKENSNVTK